MTDLVVTAGALPTARADLHRQVDALGHTVDEADHVVAAVRAAWSGAASDAFGTAWSDWREASAAVRARLATLRDLLDATDAHHRTAQAGVLRSWSAPVVTAGPGITPDAPPWVTLSTPEIVRAARVSAEVQDMVARTAGGGALASSAGFAGDDAALGAWRGRYDALARRTWSAVHAGVAIFGGMAVGLTDTANAWVEADETAVPGGRPGERLPTPAVLPGLTGPGPASATGSGPIGPLPDELTAYWPDVDPVRVDEVGAAWRAIGDVVARGVVEADGALRAVRAANAGPVFDAVDRYWRGVQGPGSGTVLDLATRVPGVLATSTSGLADIVRETQREILDAASHHPIGDDREETYYLLQGAKIGASFLGAVGRVGTRLIDAAETGLRIHLARGRYEERVAELARQLTAVSADSAQSPSGVTSVANVAASFVGAPQGPTGVIAPLTIDRQQIERKYNKHAADFGVDLPRGVTGFDEISRRIRDLVEAPTTRHVHILYRGDQVIANYDPASRLCVLQREDGSFLTGWQLSPDQLGYVATRRYLR